jgi:hypothetical protein
MKKKERPTIFCQLGLDLVKDSWPVPSIVTVTDVTLLPEMFGANLSLVLVQVDLVEPVEPLLQSFDLTLQSENSWTAADIYRVLFSGLKCRK